MNSYATNVVKYLALQESFEFNGKIPSIFNMFLVCSNLLSCLTVLNDVFYLC